MQPDRSRAKADVISPQSISYPGYRFFAQRPQIKLLDQVRRGAIIAHTHNEGLNASSDSKTHAKFIRLLHPLSRF